MNNNVIKISILFCLNLISYALFCTDVHITPLSEIIKYHPEIEYIPCYDAETFDFEPYPLSIITQLHPHKGLLAPLFILKIPNGGVFSHRGWIMIENQIIDECIPPYFSRSYQTLIAQQTLPQSPPLHIHGKVAVITTVFDDCYAHWIYNVLGRLAILQSQNIEYDWLYVAYDKPYMKETLSLWGIDPAKIITPFGETKNIIADELIVPSQPSKKIALPGQYALNWVPLHLYCQEYNLDCTKIFLCPNIQNQDIDTPLPANVSIENYFHEDTPLCGNYFSSFIITQLRNKFLPLVKKNYNFGKKIFISRADATMRKIINEDDVFSIFEQKGFKRYSLSGMSILEQIALFHEADIIVSAIGAALINLMFCKPDTKVIAVYQNNFDAAFYYLSQLLHLDYQYVKTNEFQNLQNHNENTLIPLDIIQKFVDTTLTEKE